MADMVEETHLASVSNAMAQGWSRYMTEIEVFHFDGDKPSFEAYGRENGFRHWLASDLLKMLEYPSMDAVRKAVNKAIAACANLGVPILENFKEVETEGIGKDYCLSRFACYLTVMNCNPRNPRVAAAQAYFITMAEAFRQYVQTSEGVERVLIRGEVSDREKSLSAIAYGRGVENYAFFQNAGYRGMYNMNMNDLRAFKNAPQDRSILDFMGKTELAANLFRITQTEEKISKENLKGQKNLERAHESVGREVRQSMKRISGTEPEFMPLVEDIRQVKSGLKKAGKEFAKIDGKKDPKRK
ncbi:BRO family protein [Hyphomonas sp.]|uniref:BRO family protein n=1 Tax=Hyphomonas sp. TaxID=87 RepID=UPI0025C0D878|nr:BRO family protein [Hyphomonas sp.]